MSFQLFRASKLKVYLISSPCSLYLLPIPTGEEQQEAITKGKKEAETMKKKRRGRTSSSSHSHPFIILTLVSNFLFFFPFCSKKKFRLEKRNKTTRQRGEGSRLIKIHCFSPLLPLFKIKHLYPSSIVHLFSRKKDT